MTQTPLSDNWRSLLAGYVLDDLTAQETAQVQQWLADYPEVAAELNALQESWHSLPAGLSLQAPPPHLKQQVLTAVQSPMAQSPMAQSPMAQSPAPPSRRRSRQPWRWALGVGWAATAMALVVVVSENQRLRQELVQSEAVVASFSQPSNRLYTLAGSPTQPQASGRLVVDPEDQTALIVTDELPPLPTGQVYRLWALAEADPLFCGQFNPQASQAVDQWQLPEAACGAGDVQMLITAESADDPPVPAGPLVLQSQS